MTENIDSEIKNVLSSLKADKRYINDNAKALNADGDNLILNLKDIYNVANKKVSHLANRGDAYFDSDTPFCDVVNYINSRSLHTGDQTCSILGLALSQQFENGKFVTDSHNNGVYFYSQDIADGIKAVKQEDAFYIVEHYYNANSDMYFPNLFNSAYLMKYITALAKNVKSGAKAFKTDEARPLY